jgi:hypothetical protein
MTTSAPAQQAKPSIKMTASPVPGNPLGEGRYVQTAACLIIGDEVLNGKTKDSNSNYLAKMCFDLGIELRRIEVIADDLDEIVEASRRLSGKFDLVVTSGGIGAFIHGQLSRQRLSRDQGRRTMTCALTRSATSRS